MLHRRQCGDAATMSTLGKCRQIDPKFQRTKNVAGWWFGTFFIFPYIGNNHRNWRSYFSEGWPNHQPDKKRVFFFPGSHGWVPPRSTMNGPCSSIFYSYYSYMLSKQRVLMSVSTSRLSIVIGLFRNAWDNISGNIPWKLAWYLDLFEGTSYEN